MSVAKSKSAVAAPTVAAPSLQPPLLVPVSEAARLLSVSTWEIRRLVRRGALGCKKLGRTKWLISVSSLQKFASEVGRS
jgi:excisionase family DNA binding protein